MPTNYDSKKNFLDISVVVFVVEFIIKYNLDAIIVIEFTRVEISG